MIRPMRSTPRTREVPPPTDLRLSRRSRPYATGRAVDVKGMHCRRAGPGLPPVRTRRQARTCLTKAPIPIAGPWAFRYNAAAMMPGGASAARERVQGGVAMAQQEAAGEPGGRAPPGWAGGCPCCAGAVCRGDRRRDLALCGDAGHPGSLRCRSVAAPLGPAMVSMVPAGGDEPAALPGHPVSDGGPDRAVQPAAPASPGVPAGLAGRRGGCGWPTTWPGWPGCC